MPTHNMNIMHTTPWSVNRPTTTWHNTQGLTKECFSSTLTTLKRLRTQIQIRNTHFPSMLYKMLENECLKLSNKIGAESERERIQDSTTIVRYFSETRDVSRVPSDWLQSSCYKSATKSSKCGSEILHIHLEECHTFYCRARAILQTLFSCSRKTWLDSCSFDHVCWSWLW